MAYEKNTWQAGDTITSAKLNNVETGIEAASQLLPPRRRAMRVRC